MLIDRSNRHEKGLSLIGILPNQFRKILHGSTVNPDAAWNDISKTLFWSGYLVWKKRKALYRDFWNNIAPEEWNPRRKGKKQKRNANSSCCRDPFHFLKKLKDLSKQKLTRCNCSKSSPVCINSVTLDIRSYLGAPAIHIYEQYSDSSFQDFFAPRNLNNFQTQEDKIRNQHNRGRKRKC